MRRVLWSAAVVGALAAGGLGTSGLAACGGVGGSGGGAGAGGGATFGKPCAESPLECEAGQTCWFAGGGKFTCQASGDGKKGDACTPTEGQPTCDDGLLCFKLKGSDGGVCTALCDPEANPACDSGEICSLVQIEGGEVTRVCQ